MAGRKRQRKERGNGAARHSAAISGGRDNVKVCPNVGATPADGLWRDAEETMMAARRPLPLGGVAAGQGRKAAGSRAENR
jgi:hypothetical protein